MTYADLADALDVTVPAVKSLLVRARVGLVEAAEARDADCAEIRADLMRSYDRGVKASGRARKHMRNCDACAEYRGALRGMKRSFAALTPIGFAPFALAAKIIGVGGGAGGAGGRLGRRGRRRRGRRRARSPRSCARPRSPRVARSKSASGRPPLAAARVRQAREGARSAKAVASRRPRRSSSSPSVARSPGPSHRSASRRRGRRRPPRRTRRLAQAARSRRLAARRDQAPVIEDDITPAAATEDPQVETGGTARAGRGRRRHAGPDRDARAHRPAATRRQPTPAPATAARRAAGHGARRPTAAPAPRRRPPTPEIRRRAPAARAARVAPSTTRSPSHTRSCWSAADGGPGCSRWSPCTARRAGLRWAGAGCGRTTTRAPRCATCCACPAR